MNKFPPPCRPDELKFSKYCVKRSLPHCNFIQKDLNIIKFMLSKLLSKKKSPPSKKKSPPSKKKSPPSKKIKHPRFYSSASVFNNSARRIYI